MQVYRITEQYYDNPPGDWEWWHRRDDDAPEPGVILDLAAGWLTLPRVACQKCGQSSPLYPVAMDIPEPPPPGLEAAVLRICSATETLAMREAFPGLEECLEDLPSFPLPPVSPGEFRRVEAVVRRMMRLPEWRPVRGGARVGPQPLFVNHTEYPDVMRVGGSLVISERAVRVFEQSGFTGVTWHPVRVTGCRSKTVQRLFELVVHGAAGVPLGFRHAFHHCSCCGRYLYLEEDEAAIRWRVDPAEWDGSGWMRFMDWPSVWVTAEVRGRLESSGLFLGIAFEPGDQTVHLAL
ncbi:MAG: hypothetical protein KatS3mg024_2456 [Armatimonadota bacterium]|nr:MAG: hypothetical protein KatS3mg024_2456 [Armatimonadota bacterium]